MTPADHAGTISQCVRCGTRYQDGKPACYCAANAAELERMALLPKPPDHAATIARLEAQMAERVKAHAEITAMVAKLIADRDRERVRADAVEKERAHLHRVMATRNGEIAKLREDLSHVRDAWVDARQCIRALHDCACSPTQVLTVLEAYDQRNHDAGGRGAGT